jgi:excisionase family DNA binding protein
MTTLTLTLRETAELTGFSLRVIEAAIVRGDLRARKAPGNERTRRILRSDIDVWLESLPDA